MPAYVPVSLAYNAIITKDALDHIEAGIAAAAPQIETTAALALKAPLASPSFTGIVSGITKSMVGLGNVDNTADANKPISNAMQSALNGKASLDSPAFTGTPTINGSPIGSGGGSAVDAYTKSQTDNLLAAKASTANPTFTGKVTGVDTTMLPDFTNAVKTIVASSGGGTGTTAPTTLAVTYDPATGLITPTTDSLTNLDYDSSTGLVSLKSGVTTVSAAALITRSNGVLSINSVRTRLGGANAYWLGLDDNNGVNFPSKTTITNAMKGMRSKGVNLVRAHTVGISTGTPQSFETAAGVFNHDNLDAADYAVYQAKQNGIYLMVPLTDNWNYYHGGKWNFVHWAYQQNSSGITDTPGTTKDDVNERIFFANTAPGLRVRALFKAYISAWLNHVNPYTGLAYKDDPTIAILETGNEIYYAAQLGTNEWTQDIASYIKSIAPNKLVADGSAADRVAVSSAPGLTAAAVDIVGAHYYPQQQSGQYPPVNFTATGSGYPAGTAIQQLAADATAASNAGKAFIVGEYPWTRSDVAQWYAAVENNTAITGDMFWAMIGTTTDGTPEVHGGAFGSDDYALHIPFSGTNEQTYGPALATHISKVTGVPQS
jgi:hypothetical protein